MAHMFASVNSHRLCLSATQSMASSSFWAVQRRAVKLMISGQCENNTVALSPIQSSALPSEPQPKGPQAKPQAHQGP